MYINATLFICVFVNNTADEYGLAYNEHVCGSEDRNLVYIRRETKAGQKWRKNRTVMFSRFSSIEVAKRAGDIRCHVKMDKDNKLGLNWYLVDASKPKPPKNKASVADISPEDTREANVSFRRYHVCCNTPSHLLAEPSQGCY